jgi:hypothetical protein
MAKYNTRLHPGAGTFGHFLQMLKLSTLRHLALPIVIGVTVGTLGFALTLSEQQRHQVVPYVGASVKIAGKQWVGNIFHIHATHLRHSRLAFSVY